MVVTIMSKAYKTKIFLEYLSLGSGLCVVATTEWNNVANKSGLLGLLFLCMILCTLLLLYGLEFRIFHQLKEFNFRNGATAGLWTCIMLPITLIIQIHSYEKLNTLNLQWTWYWTSVCTFGLSLLVISALCCSSKPKKLFRSTANLLICLTLICIGFALIHFVGGIGMTASLFLSASSQLIFFYLIWHLPEFFPWTFSFGEVLFISQCVSSFVSSSVCHVYLHLNSRQLPILTDQIALFIEVSLLGCCLVIILCAALCYYLKSSLVYVIMSFILVGFIFVIPLLSFTLRVDPITWGLSFLVENNKRVSLFGLWLLLLVMSVVFSQSVLSNNRVNKPTTVLRKYFHLMVLGVFIPGIIFDQDFLRISSALLFGIFVLLECLRFFDIPPISGIINNHFKFFLDEKDQGPLILSHIYLLVGSSIPIWLCSSGIHSFSGVISIGIGDAFASIGGKMFGKHRWPESSKTIEGTIISIVTQLISVKILEKTDIFPVFTTYAFTGIIISTSLLEAFTTQIDNLVVPLVFFVLLMSAAVMFASSLKDYSVKVESTSKLKPRLKSASSVSRVQEVFNKSVVLANKKVKARAKSATLPSRYHEKKNRYSQDTSVARTEEKIWPPIIKTHSVTSWKRPDSCTLTAIPYASQPMHYMADFDRSMDYVTKQLGKSNLNKKDDQLIPAFNHEKATKIRYYTYDSDVDSQEDGYELLESTEDLKDEGVERIDLPPSSSRIIPLATYNSLQQKIVRVVHRDSSSYVSCPQCHTHVAIPTASRVFTPFSPRSEIDSKSPPFSPPAARASPQPLWQAAHAIELTVPKMQSSVPSPTLSLPLDKKIYYRSTE
uniref:dolichol kinase n=1 Tax=Strigamia maritima TaxID=126957 RepID=T1J6W6_STRMM